MKLIDQIPEMPITEDWTWQTDVHTSDDGSELRIMLSPLPKRTLRTQMMFDTERDVQRMMLNVLGIGAPYRLPFYHQAARLKAVAAPGASILTLDTMRSDFRVGCEVLIFDTTGGSVYATVQDVTEDAIELTAPLASGLSKRAQVVPVWPMYAEGQAALSRTPGNMGGNMSLVSREMGFLYPFLGFAPEMLPTFDGLPVLESMATGTEFVTSADTGAEWFDFGGQVEYRNRQQHAQLVFPRTYLCQRVLEPATWRRWRTFADYAKGALNPFYVSSGRDDFELIAPAMPNGSTLTFKGPEYAAEWAPFNAFRGLEIHSPNGTHRAKTTTAEVVAGNTVVTFAPAVPNVAGWQTDQHVSLLLKARIADDVVSCEHHALHSLVSLNLRTVDE